MRRARVGAGGGSDFAAEARLPLSLHFEVSQPGEVERDVAGHARIRGEEKIPRTQVIVDVDAVWLM